MKYWVFADETFVCSIDSNKKEAARRICAAVNACAGVAIETLEFAAEESTRLDFEGRLSRITELETRATSELDRLRAQNAEFVFLLRQADKLDRDGYTLTSTWFHEVRNALAKYDQPANIYCDCKDDECERCDPDHTKATIL